MGSEPKMVPTAVEMDHHTFLFKVIGYSLKKGMGVGQFVRSATFTIGGYDWAIRFYPDGKSAPFSDHVGVYVELMSKNTTALAFYDLGLVSFTTARTTKMCAENPARVFSSWDESGLGPRTPVFISRANLEDEQSGYIRGDSLIIECNLCVIKKSESFKTTQGTETIKVPPSDLSENFGKLLSDGEAADVTFSVGGEIFPAHKLVLATRSPVFKAELYGQMMERTAQCITVEDMLPTAFKALLHFIYTDLLPDFCDLERDDYVEMIRHLLVAADRYAMDRLKLLCASILADSLHVENVATMLALADQHSCNSLKDVCIEFMASSDKMDAVIGTQGYASIKRKCPSVLVDVLERISRYRKMEVRCSNEYMSG
ncbi:hypothetical protein ACP70R_003305 [Stipagrostis hirtigluma subsp. patula]